MHDQAGLFGGRLLGDLLMTVTTVLLRTRFKAPQLLHHIGIARRPQAGWPL